MKAPLHIRSARRGSALVTVLMLSIGLMIIIASTLAYSLNERRMNYREAMRLEARNAAEAVAEYGLSQVRQLMESRSNFQSGRFTSNESQIALPPDSFWAGSNVPYTGSTSPAATSSNIPELIVGIVSPVTTSTSSSLYYYSPSDPDNAYDPLKGCYAFRYDIRVISKATVVPPAGGAGSSQTCYMTQTLSSRASPLFSRAIFYNMDLEIMPGPAMNILGAVHTNGNMYARKQSSSGLALNFVGPVTIAGGLYSAVKCNFTNQNGTQDDFSGYTDNVYFSNAAGGLVAFKNTSSGLWQDQKWGHSSESSTTQASFRTYWAQNSQGNLQTSLMGVQPMNPPGIGTYVEDPTPGNGIDNSVNSAHAMIEPPLNSSDPGYNQDVELQKYSAVVSTTNPSARCCGLYICVNPTTTARNGRKPDGTIISIPGLSASVSGDPTVRYHYRCFLKDGTEIVLPGQPDYGSDNTTPNTAGNVGGAAIVRVRQNEMFDMRRTTYTYGTARSSSNPYNLKPITTIDIDMAALKMAVAKTVNGSASMTGYLTTPPADGTSSALSAWTSYIYNPSATTTSIALTVANSIMDPSGPSTIGSANWNGGIYIESIDANQLAKNSDGSTNTNYRNGTQASGVRLINGRGVVASNSAGDGLTLVTNDEVYILGNFNADGTINTASSGTTNSGRYPESGEVPSSICCDALTILSTPLCTFSGSPTVLKQTMGHNDAFSGLRCDSSGWSSSWRTSAPSNSNTLDGYNSISGGSNPYNGGTLASVSSGPTAITGYRCPYDGSLGNLTSASSSTTKLPGNDTEISAAFLAGIVPSNKDNNGQNSGAANNYPRFNEDFSASGSQKTVAIRGSIVAMYESRAGTEPWNWRVFSAPTRLWGFNQLFANGQFPPLTPIVMSYRRIDFNDIDRTTYAAVKSSWGL